MSLQTHGHIIPWLAPTKAQSKIEIHKQFYFKPDIMTMCPKVIFPLLLNSEEYGYNYSISQNTAKHKCCTYLLGCLLPYNGNFHHINFHLVDRNEYCFTLYFLYADCSLPFYLPEIPQWFVFIPQIPTSAQLSAVSLLPSCWSFGKNRWWPIDLHHYHQRQNFSSKFQLIRSIQQDDENTFHIIISMALCQTMLPWVH